MRDQSIEDFDLSPRTFALLRGLGVTTVGQLLDLTKIEIPREWPRKVGRLVAAELSEIFTELGVEDKGAIVALPAIEAKSKATSATRRRTTPSRSSPSTTARRSSRRWSDWARCSRSRTSRSQERNLW